MVADTGLDHTDLAAAVAVARSDDAPTQVADDIELGSQRLRVLLADADAIPAHR